MFAARLKALREKKDLSQMELANILDVAQQTVASWEKGKSSPNYDLLKRIAVYFHVTADYLLGLTDSPMSPAENSAFIQAVLASEDKRAIMEALNLLPPETVAHIRSDVEFYLSVQKQQPKAGLLLGQNPFNRKVETV